MTKPLSTSVNEAPSPDASGPYSLFGKHVPKPQPATKPMDNIALRRPITSVIAFKQIISGGTRTFAGQDFFTIDDVVKRHEHFHAPKCDGEPLPPQNFVHAPQRQAPRQPQADDRRRSSRYTTSKSPLPQPSYLPAAPGSGDNVRAIPS